MAKIEIYTKATCFFCHRAKALLEQKGLAFQEYKIDAQPNLRPEMIERSDGGYTVPQIFINNNHIGGCDDIMALESQGKLDQIIAQ